MALNKALLYSGPADSIVIGSVTVNYTLGGVSIACETVKGDLHCDQIPGPAIKKKVSQKFTISFNVPELTNDLLLYAYDQPDSNIVTTNLTVNNLSRSGEIVTVNIPSVTGRVKQFVFTKCYCIGVNEIKFGKDQQAAWELKFETVYSSIYGTVIEGT